MGLVLALAFAVAVRGLLLLRALGGGGFGVAGMRPEGRNDACDDDAEEAVEERPALWTGSSICCHSLSSHCHFTVHPGFRHLVRLPNHPP